MEAPQPSDESLMLRYRRGDDGAFETLYRRHRGPVHRYFVRHVGEAVAEELYQDTWMRVIAARARYERRARFTTWLYRIAHNLAVDHLRRLGARVKEDGLDLDSTDMPEAATVAGNRRPEQLVDDRAAVARLLTLLEQLPPAQREAFLLHEEAGLSVAGIAEVTGASREAAKSRLRYAIAALRQGLSS